MEHVGLVLGTITVAAVVTLVLGLLIARRHRHFTMRVTFDVERDDTTTTRQRQENQIMTDTPDTPEPEEPAVPVEDDDDQDDEGGDSET